LCEATYNSDTNQQYLMQTIAASKQAKQSGDEHPLCGRTSLNTGLPVLIK
jgi:hypothetical protein